MGTRDVNLLTHLGKDPVPMHGDSSIVYSRTAPQANNDKAFKVTAEATVGLVTAGDVIDGRIVLAEEDDGVSTKVTAQFFGLLPFRYSGTTPTFGQAIIGAANGFVAAVAAGTADSRGKVLQVFPADNIVVVKFD